MTNGEKIKEVFPKARIEYHKATDLVDEYVTVFIDSCDTCQDYSMVWWNMEYKEPTTKDDIRACKICVHSKDGKCAGTEECHGCMWDSKYSPKNGLGVDAVRREEVDRLACRYLKEPTDNHVAFYEEFLDLPSVTSIRPKGHWKLVQRGKNIDICCSNCGAVRIKGYAYNYTIDQLSKEDLKECFECADMRYCPNCGADMKEDKE